MQENELDQLYRAGRVEHDARRQIEIIDEAARIAR